MWMLNIPKSLSAQGRVARYMLNVQIILLRSAKTTVNQERLKNKHVLTSLSVYCSINDYPSFIMEQHEQHS